MHGLMMQQPLLVASLLTHAERHHGGQEIVSRRVEGDIHRYRYRDLAQRARKLANALADLGINQGERVGTLQGRTRRIAIVAMARKLLIALWRYVETGVVPDGVALRTDSVARA